MTPKIILMQFEKVKQLLQELRKIHNCTATTLVEQKLEILIKELEVKIKSYQIAEEERFLR